MIAHPNIPARVAYLNRALFINPENCYNREKQKYLLGGRQIETAIRIIDRRRNLGMQ